MSPVPPLGQGDLQPDWPGRCRPFDVRLIDRLNELDYRFGFQRRPGAAPPEVQPLSPGRVALLRAIWGIWLVVLLLTVITAVVSGNLLPPLLVLLPGTQLLIMNPQHRQQLLKPKS